MDAPEDPVTVTIRGYEFIVDGVSKHQLDANLNSDEVLLLVHNQLFGETSVLVSNNGYTIEFEDMEYSNTILRSRCLSIDDVPHHKWIRQYSVAFNPHFFAKEGSDEYARLSYDETRYIRELFL